MKPGGRVRGKERRFDAATLRFLPEGVIRLEGRILSHGAEAEIAKCLWRFHEAMLDRKRRRVVVDVARLEWITESAVTALVAWVLCIRLEPADRRYRVVFRINAAVPWQHGTFRALLGVAPDVVKLETAR